MLAVTGINLIAPMFSMNHLKGFMPQNSSQIIMKRSFFFRRISIHRKYFYKRNECLLNRILRINSREMLTHVRFHKRAVSRDELPPSRMLGIYCERL